MRPPYVAICALGPAGCLPGSATTQASAAGSVGNAPTAALASHQAPADEAIRPFRARVPDADLADLRRRLAATRWPDKETVADASQDAQLAKVQGLVRYWATDYDWRKAEAKLNAFPQFMTRVDGLDVHFIHVRSRHPNALPVIVTHGGPARSSSRSSWSARSPTRRDTAAGPRMPSTS